MRNNAALKAVFEWAEMFAVSVCVVLTIMTLIVRHSPVTGHSMYPTLIGSAVGVSDSFAAEPGKNDVLLVSNLFYTPHAGDVVVTQSDFRMDEPLVKRVIAVGGQSLAIDFNSWQVTVDGITLDEDYIYREEGFSMREENFYEVMSDCERADDGSFIIPQGYIFCMGDNRNHSSDSRFIEMGLIDDRYVIGHVFFRVFPFDRVGAVG